MPTKVQARILDSRNITTTWSLSALRSEETANITKFLVSFGHQIFKNRPPYNMSPAGEVKYNTSVALDAQYSLLIVSPTDLRPNITYKVEVSVLDTKGCRGPVANHIFTMPVQPLVQSSPPPVVVGNASLQRVLVTVLPVMSFVVVCILAAAMLWQRCGNCIRRKLREGRLQQIHSWRGIYKVINNDSSTSRITNSFPILHQERNVIYVEQEIEEAKARGDADTFEVSYDRLELGRQIGKGAFGRVFLARAEAIADKASADEVEEFLSEIAMMKRVGRHPNVVRMVGCCTLKQPYCMLMEYVPCGDLLQYLRQLRVEYERRTGGAFAISSTMIRPVPRYVDLQLPLTYALMLQCWSHSADFRPSFAELEAHLDSVICRKRVYVDFTTLKPDYSFPPIEQQTQQSSNGKSSK
ncbi:hypothetical protein C0J52_11278 [Blattella germanica]|nr:hypothetical protein C0J52_11278 [Blattella germanica]